MIRSLPVRLLFFLLSLLPATALPDFEEARRRLGSQDFEEREALTLELWQTGPAAIPLLEKLAAVEDPEVSRRARFVLKRVRIGLGPGAPDELLTLAELADQAGLGDRRERLADLLDHAEGFPIAVVFLNQWLSAPHTSHEHRLSLARVFVESLVQQRRSWQDFIATPLSVETKAYLIGVLGVQHSPVTHSLMAMLASSDLRKIHGLLLEHFEALPDESHLIMARLAIVAQDLALAGQTLAHGLTQSESPRLGRALAFLEAEAQLPPVAYAGRWSRELALFRDRARGHLDDIPEKTRRLQDHSLLAYESDLLAGHPRLPEEEDALSRLAAPEALPAWHAAFGRPPEDPDIEALSSSLLIDWPDLARTLTALAHPQEAAERLASEGQVASAIGLLWRTGRQAEARKLAETHLSDPNGGDPLPIRLTLASLSLQAGQKKEARDFLRPLLQDGIENDTRRRSAIPLALKLFPLEEVTAIEPGLTADRAFRRRPAVTAFLDFPPRVSSEWYEKVRAKDPDEDPSVIITRVRELLENRSPEAREVVAQDWAASTKDLLLPGDPLYENVLFFQLPGSLEMVEKAAWYQLSTEGLTALIRSEDWPLAMRHRALASALEINPTDPVLRWWDRQFHQVGDPGMITLLTLGDPGLALQLGRQTGRRESIETAARVGDFKDASTLRCLAILGQSHLDDAPEKAARLLLAARCGEIAFGPHPATSISTTLDELRDLYRARERATTDEAEKALWQDRMRQLGASTAPSGSSGAEEEEK